MKIDEILKNRSQINFIGVWLGQKANKESRFWYFLISLGRYEEKKERKTGLLLFELVIKKRVFKLKTFAHPHLSPFEETNRVLNVTQKNTSLNYIFRWQRKGVLSFKGKKRVWKGLAKNGLKWRFADRVTVLEIRISVMPLNDLTY